jgi:hypothetical protein
MQDGPWRLTHRSGHKSHSVERSDEASVRNDFDTALTESGVIVTFKPTNNIYSFYRLADGDVARLGPVSLERVRHAGASGETEG